MILICKYNLIIKVLRGIYFFWVCSIVICRIDHLLIRAFILGKKEESNKHANVAIVLNRPENQTRKRALQDCSRIIFFTMFDIFSRIKQALCIENNVIWC